MNFLMSVRSVTHAMQNPLTQPPSTHSSRLLIMSARRICLEDNLYSWRLSQHPQHQSRNGFKFLSDTHWTNIYNIYMHTGSNLNKSYKRLTNTCISLLSVEAGLADMGRTPTHRTLVPTHGGPWSPNFSSLYFHK